MLLQDLVSKLGLLLIENCSLQIMIEAWVCANLDCF